MKILKLIGLLFLFCFTFFYTEKVIDISVEQDDIMLSIKEHEKELNVNPINAIIDKDNIIPGKKGKYVDKINSYKAMKKIGYFDKSLLIYEDIYPEISIYNNYDLYITNGNKFDKQISLIFILNNNNTIDNVISIANRHNIPINFFINSNLLNNDLNIIEKIKNHEIYNYGFNGTYTKDNLLITNNIIHHKALNKPNICLFKEKNKNSHDLCTKEKMFSIHIDKITNLNNIKNNLANGKIFIIDNSQELDNIIQYILKKGYKIVTLSNNIHE